MSLECINALYYSSSYLGLSSDLRHSGLAFEHWPQTTPQQREEWNHHTHGAMVTDMEDSKSDDVNNMIPPYVYPEESGWKEEENPC